MTTGIFNTTAIISTIFSLWFLFRKRLRTYPTWHATITPLASIIGSGFLVSAPLLLLTTGKWALPVMAAITLIAYALGSSLRFNILYVEPQLERHSSAHWVYFLETISRPILGIAYIISVAFYLKLLSAFALRGIGLHNILYENSLVTLLLLLIGIIGKIRGLHILELFEVYSVNTKLAIIFAVIVTHVLYNSQLLLQGKWLLKIYSHEDWWLSFCKVLGMLIIIQGFETSRYLGQAYSQAIRIKTMKYAQWISAAIYILYVALSMVLFKDIHQVSETTIIDLCKIIAPVLPILLIIAAIMSQFSAAVADTIGSGGLLSEATYKKISVNSSYFLITLTAIGLTWLTDIYGIITIASKAFAIYYALQIILTLLSIKKIKHIEFRIIKFIFYTSLLLLMVAVIILGSPIK